MPRTRQSSPGGLGRCSRSSRAGLTFSASLALAPSSAVRPCAMAERKGPHLPDSHPGVLTHGLLELAGHDTMPRQPESRHPGAAGLGSLQQPCCSGERTWERDWVVVSVMVGMGCEVGEVIEKQPYLVPLTASTSMRPEWTLARWKPLLAYTLHSVIAKGASWQFC